MRGNQTRCIAWARYWAKISKIAAIFGQFFTSSKLLDAGEHMSIFQRLLIQN